MCEIQVCPICRDSNPIPTWSPTHGSNVHKAGKVRARYHRSCIQGWLMHLAKQGEEKMTDPCSKLRINACLRDLFPTRHSFWTTWANERQRRQEISSGMSPKKRARMNDSSGRTIASMTTCEYSCRLVLYQPSNSQTCPLTP